MWTSSSSLERSAVVDLAQFWLSCDPMLGVFNIQAGRATRVHGPLIAPWVQYQYKQSTNLTSAQASSKVELDEFHEPWKKEVWDQWGHCGAVSALQCLVRQPTAVYRQKFESRVCEIHN